MKNLKEILLTIIEKDQLERKIEWSYMSEIDYRKALDEFGYLLDVINEDLKEYPYSAGVRNCLEDLAEEVRQGYIDIDTIEGISFYTFDEYVETFITEDMTEGERKIFDSFWYFMDLQTRKEWVEAEYWSDCPELYTNKMKDFVLKIEF